MPGGALAHLNGSAAPLHPYQVLRSVCQIITASISGLWESPQKEIWIWLWGWYFVSAAVRCMQVILLIHHRQRRHPSAFLLTPHVPCLLPIYSLCTSISPVVLLLSVPSFYHSILNFKLTNISISGPHFSPSAMFYASLAPHAALWSGSDCTFRASSIDSIGASV